MKDILKTVRKIPRFKLYLSIFVLSILISQGVAIQIIPFVDREVLSIIQDGLAKDNIDIRKLFPLAWISIFAITAYSALQRVSYTVANMLRENVWNYIFKEGFQKLIYHDIEFLSSERSGEQLNKVNRASYRIASLFTEASSALLRNFIKALAALIIVFAISWEIGFLLLLAAVVYGIVYYIRFRADIPLAKERDQISDKEFSRVWEVVPQAKLTKIFGREKYEVDRIDEINERVLVNVWKREMLWTKASFVENFLVNIPIILIKFLAAYFALQGRYGIPTFVLLYTMISTVQEPLWVINWFMWEFQDTMNRAKKYLEIIRSKEKITDSENPEEIQNPKGDIEFQDVVFHYRENKKNVLDKINLNFEGGRVTALVGKSGAGKTTITNLITRFFDPTDGKVTLGGQSLKNVRKSDYRKYLGFVLQESYVFSGTIEENLRYAKEDATREEMVEALRKAQALEFVEELPKGIETEVGERGVKLSGGQRQRLSIARTILKNPQILILDEATNALDSESEVAVQKALEEFMKGKTVIIIAHRLSTIIRSDKIYVIDEGKVLEEGNHEELLKKGGVYKMLHDIQSGDFEKNKKVLEEYEMA